MRFPLCRRWILCSCHGFDPRHRHHKQPPLKLLGGGLFLFFCNFHSILQLFKSVKIQGVAVYRKILPYTARYYYKKSHEISHGRHHPHPPLFRGTVRRGGRRSFVRRGGGIRTRPQGRIVCAQSNLNPATIVLAENFSYSPFSAQQVKST